MKLLFLILFTSSLFGSVSSCDSQLDALLSKTKWKKYTKFKDPEIFSRTKSDLLDSIHKWISRSGRSKGLRDLSFENAYAKMGMNLDLNTPSSVANDVEHLFFKVQSSYYNLVELTNQSKAIEKVLLKMNTQGERGNLLEYNNLLLQNKKLKNYKGFEFIRNNKSYYGLKSFLGKSLIDLYDRRVRNAVRIFENKSEYLGVMSKLKSVIRSDVFNPDTIDGFARSQRKFLINLHEMKSLNEEVEKSLISKDIFDRYVTNFFKEYKDEYKGVPLDFSDLKTSEISYIINRAMLEIKASVVLDKLSPDKNLESFAFELGKRPLPKTSPHKILIAAEEFSVSQIVSLQEELSEEILIAIVTAIPDDLLYQFLKKVFSSFEWLGSKRLKELVSTFVDEKRILKFSPLVSELVRSDSSIKTKYKVFYDRAASSNRGDQFLEIFARRTDAKKTWKQFMSISKDLNDKVLNLDKTSSSNKSILSDPDVLFYNRMLKAQEKINQGTIEPYIITSTKTRYFRLAVTSLFYLTSTALGVTAYNYKDEIFPAISEKVQDFNSKKIGDLIP